MSLTARYFNEKYKSSIGEGHPGLEIHHPKVVEYLDKVFEKLDLEIKIDYIRMKFGVARVYLGEGLTELSEKLEDDINSIVKYYNNPYPDRVHVNY